jgi:hypothetical protein
MALPAIAQPVTNPSSHWPALALLGAGLVFLAGCATKSNDRSAPTPREDLAEYRQIAVDAQQVVRATLQSLDRTVARTPCPHRAFKTFTKDVQRLEVDSFKVRARAQAIRTRGQAYFEQWQEHLASVQDPEVRKLAEQRRDHLQERFSQIRLHTQQAREAFQPFMAGLRRLRNGLENDPAVAGTDSMKELIRATRDNGQKVEAGLAAILVELDAVAAILKPDTAAKKG